MIPRLREVYQRENFLPSWLSIFINPFFFVRRGLYRGIERNKDMMKGVMLDFGCGSKPYRDIFDVTEYVGLDIEVSGHPHTSETIDVYYDGKTIPFPDNHFDSVFCSEVMEHVFNIEEILGELFRVMKPGAGLLLTVPFVWIEHEIPYDFARYTSFGVHHLLEGKGFRVIRVEKTTNYVETVTQMWNVYTYQHLLPRNPYLKVLLTPLLISPVTLCGMVLSRVLPDRRDFPSNNIVVAEKPR